MLNTKFVFKNEFNWFKMLRFFLVYGISFVLNIAYMFLLVEFFGLHKLIAQIVAVGLNMVFNFVMSRFWVFNNEKNRLHN
jgi:putative flippase GtrA